MDSHKNASNNKKDLALLESKNTPRVHAALNIFEITKERTLAISSIFRKKINEMLTLAAGRTTVDDISNLKFCVFENFSFFEKKYDTFSFVLF